MKFFLLFLSSLAIQASIAQPLSGSVRPYNGRPTVFINDTPEYPMLYALTDVPGGRWAWEELPRYNIKSFCQLNIKLVQVDIAFDQVWQRDNTLNLDTIRLQLRAVRNACKDAAIFIRFHVNPPKWWQQEFRKENTLYADRKAKPDIDFGMQRIIEDDEETPERHSLASEKWKSEAGNKLTELLKNLEATPEGDALVGIQVAGGVYGEWHYWGFIENEPDVSEPMTKFFRAWLKKRYGTDKALQKAWGNKTITLNNVSIPDTTARYQTRHGIFRDPVLERNVIDYYEAQHELVADDILFFCRIVKESWTRPIITGAFYGYFYSVFGREAAGGHLALDKVLRSPYIDYLSGPGTYYPDAVEMGAPYRSRSLINSISLHGKLWLDEMDQQAPLLPIKHQDYQQSIDKSIAQVRRNLFFTFSKGHGLWFYDFGPSGFNGGPRLQDHGSWGWWDHPKVLDDIRQLKVLFEKSSRKPYASHADVLLVHDTQSFNHLGSHKDHSYMMHWTNNWPTVAIFKSGVVHDVIHLDDLKMMDLAQYKVVVFMNTVLLTDEIKKIIKEKVAVDNRHLVWIYAPGFSDGQSLDKKFIESVTGFSLEKISSTDATQLSFDSTIVKNYTASVFQKTVEPLFAVRDTQAKSFGQINKSGLPGFAQKTLKSSTSWFLTIPPNNAAVWRFIFEKAGAHIFTKDESIVYEGGGLLSVHTKAGGRMTVALRNKKPVELNLKPNTTIILNAETGDVVME